MLQGALVTRPIRRGRPWPPCKSRLTTVAIERGLAQKWLREFARRWFALVLVWFEVKP